MRVYGDLYDEALNEIYGEQMENLPLWVTGGKTPAELMAENDPTAYRCGFADWTDSLRDSPPDCDECGRTIEDFDVCDDDDIVCPVCKGDAFECSECGEVKDNDELDDGDVCKACAAAEA